MKLQDHFASALIGAAAGVTAFYILNRHSTAAHGLSHQQAIIDSLPNRIILVRHGESEGNVDPTKYYSTADNKIELTEKGRQQAIETGRKIKELLGDQRAMVIASPFQRCYQTIRNMRMAHLEENIAWTTIDPRIREQEMGNLQDENFAKQRLMQKQVGRFWYRFEGGESGADVYDRTSTFWGDFRRINSNPKRDRVDNVIIVTHGLAMRLLLMSLFHWSPDTFETVWNPPNAGMWVLTKRKSYDHARGGELPYKISDEGLFPESSRSVRVTFKDGTTDDLRLADYLTIKPPRTAKRNEPQAIKMIAEQHKIPEDQIVAIDFHADKGFRSFI